MTDRNAAFKSRVEEFVDNCVRLANLLPASRSNQQAIPQFIDSSTSIGANYSEACEAESSKDFVHKMKVAKKELRETTYWLRLLYKTNKGFIEEIIKLGKESVELTKIIASIVLKFSSKE